MKHARDNIPHFLISLLEKQYAKEDSERIIDGYQAKRATTLRANRLKTNPSHIAASLTGAGIPYHTLAWYEDAFIMPPGSEPTIRTLECYSQGGIYLQSLSSMLPALALHAQPGDDVLDMCAAPGGKTTQIAALTQNSAPISACELHAPRAEKLRYTLRLQGAEKVNVMQTDARRLDDFLSFDRILVDAPCSGSGTLQLDEQRFPAQFTEKLIQKSTKTQSALLDKALKLIKPGGTVIYSTCSILECENESIVRKALTQANKRGTYTLQELPLSHEGAPLWSQEPSLTPVPLAPLPLSQAPTLAPPLPSLPTSLDGTCCLCPTELFEGFFLARITCSDK